MGMIDMHDYRQLLFQFTSIHSSTLLSFPGIFEVIL